MKLKNKKGFSLSEVLIAVLILAMMTSVVAAGIPAASNAYRSVVNASNAQQLLTIVTETLRSELDMAEDVQIVSGASSIEYEGSLGTTSRLYINSNQGNQIYVITSINLSADATDAEKAANDRCIVTRASAGNNLYAVCESITSTVASGFTIVTFNNLKVLDALTNGNTLAELAAYSVRVGF